MLNKMTVREWIRNFKDGKYDNPYTDTQWKAGWADYFCDENELSIRLRKLGYIISGITNDIILDYFTLKLYNRCAGTSPDKMKFYDEILFEPIFIDVNSKYYYSFFVSINPPKIGNEYLFDVAVSWRDYDSEFSCNDLNMLYANLNIMMNNLYKRPILISDR